jgi:hypothetical protein
VLGSGDRYKVYIIVHAGTWNRFIFGESLVFILGTRSGDYCDAMNGENFEHWVLTQVLPHLEEPSLTMVDNTL